MSRLAEPHWLAASRADAAKEASHLGLPDHSNEDWKHIVAQELLFPATDIAPEDSLARLAAESLAPEAWAALVFIGGVFRPDISRLPKASSQWTIAPLSEAIASNEAEIRSQLGRNDPVGLAPFALSRARSTDGLFLRVADGVILPGLVQIVDVASGTSWLRNLVVLNAGARATLLETHVSPANTATASHTVTETDIPLEARLEHVRVQRGAREARAWNALIARLSSHASLEARHFGLGGKTTRAEIHVDLEAPGADLSIEGLVAAHEDDLFDALTSVRHLAKDCASHQLWKSLAQDRATAAFAGNVHVAQGADGTAASQSNRNILLSRTATIHSRPQLEIWADDVKCSHGSATGKLDEKALFFLRSRGLSALDARRVLVKAFAEEVLGKIPWESVRGTLETLLGERI